MVSGLVLVGADESQVDVSGCSNDSLFRAVKTIFREMNLEFPVVPPILYRDSHSIRCVSREEFRDLVKIGMINEETIVFNNTLQTLSEYRQGLWEVPMKDSWHIEAFPISVRK